MDQTTERVKVTIRLPLALVRTAKHAAVDRDQDLQDVIAQCLEQCLNAKDQTKTKTKTKIRGGR
jgi:hypothetical protein